MVFPLPFIVNFCLFGAMVILYFKSLPKGKSMTLNTEGTNINRFQLIQRANKERA
jgi:hypothetical protein